MSVFSQFDDDDLDTVDQINTYRDKMKGNPVLLEQYFLYLGKFVMSVIQVRMTVDYNILSKQKWFHLKGKKKFHRIK